MATKCAAGLTNPGGPLIKTARKESGSDAFPLNPCLIVKPIFQPTFQLLDLSFITTQLVEIGWSMSICPQFILRGNFFLLKPNVPPLVLTVALTLSATLAFQPLFLFSLPPLLVQ